MNQMTYSPYPKRGRGRPKWKKTVAQGTLVVVNDLKMKSIDESLDRKFAELRGRAPKGKGVNRVNE